MNRFCVFALAVALMLETLACGGGSSTSTNTQPPPTPGSMAGAWDFTATGGAGQPVAVEAVLTEDSKGNLSASGTVTATGPAGSVSEIDVFGPSLASASDIAVDYLGNTCGNDDGNRKVTGTINSSNTVALTFDSGGGFTVTINGTLTPSANPPFSGTFSVAAPGCKANGSAGNITAVMASSLSGTYSGTNAADNAETITATVTDTNGTLSANGNDSVLGAFTLSGTTVGNAFSGTLTFPGNAGASGPVFGYFDPQLGAKGSVLLTSFQGGNAVSCPSGVPIDNGSCLIGVLALQ